MAPRKLTTLNGRLKGQPMTLSVVKIATATSDKWDPLESTCRHASLSIL